VLQGYVDEACNAVVDKTCETEVESALNAMPSTWKRDFLKAKVVTS
jgi:hypothetical protein